MNKLNKLINIILYMIALLTVFDKSMQNSKLIQRLKVNQNSDQGTDSFVPLNIKAFQNTQGT